MVDPDRPGCKGWLSKVPHGLECRIGGQRGQDKLGALYRIGDGTACPPAKGFCPVSW